MKRLLTLLIATLVLGAGCTPMLPSDETKPLQSTTPRPNERTSQTPTPASSLDLSGRGLVAIPSDVFSKTDLEVLNLSNNKLTGAPQAEIRHLQKLKSLDLSNNRLTGLSAELGQLKNLEILDVSNNQLTGLPMELGNLTQLRVLDVSGNNYSTQDLDQIAAKLKDTEIKR